MTTSMRLHSLESRFRTWLLGSHPYNTIFNYNWANVRPMIRTFRALRGLIRGTVVDLGAGSSPYYGLTARTAEKYVAVDWPHALPRREKRPISRVAGCAEAIPLAAASADTVLCTQVLYQVRSPSEAFREIDRVLRPGGHAIVSVPHVSPLHCEPHDLYRFTPDGLRRLAESSGLRATQVSPQGLLFSSFALCLAMALVLTPVAPGEPMRLRPGRQLLFAPVIALINALALLLDTLLPFNRVPVNFVLVAEKPAE